MNAFIFHKRAYLKDTNAEGNVYFSRYFEWMGEAREDFFRQAVHDHQEILQSGTRLITVHSWMKNEQASYVFDEIVISIQTTSLKKMSMELGFTLTHKATGQVIAVGGQKLAFADREGRLILIPPSIRAGAATCLADSNATVWHMELIRKKPAEHDLLTA